MKWIVIILTALALLFVVFQVYSMSTTKNIEMYDYTVVKTVGEVEIRTYEAANFSYVVMPDSGYRNNSSDGFRTLAGYIFGGNETGEKIAMTSPVAMDMKDSMTMMFMIPSEYDIEDLPKPNSDEVNFKHIPAKTVAAIRFGGWADDEKIEKYKAKLTAALDKAGIAHTGNFQYLGYNPPYEVVNRRNEVIVELK